MRVLDEKRIRKISKGFCWIDRRFLQEKWIYHFTTNEILYYLWLILASDRYGISFYSKEKTSTILKISIPKIDEARNGLEQKGFIVSKDDVVQILDLPVGTNHLLNAETEQISGVSTDKLSGNKNNLRADKKSKRSSDADLRPKVEANSEIAKRCILEIKKIFHRE